MSMALKPKLKIPTEPVSVTRQQRKTVLIQIIAIVAVFSVMAMVKFWR
jgi:hypothetical protein